jgi:hypothetical protein
MRNFGDDVGLKFHQAVCDFQFFGCYLSSVHDGDASDLTNPVCHEQFSSQLDTDHAKVSANVLDSIQSRLMVARLCHRLRLRSI